MERRYSEKIKKWREKIERGLENGDAMVRKRRHGRIKPSGDQYFQYCCLCNIKKPFQESYLVSQESYLVWDVLLCMILYLNIFQCIVCLEYVLNLWDSVILLKFLEMDSWKWMVTGGQCHV